MSDVADRRLHLIELARMREAYIAQDKLHFVAYLDRLIARLEVEIALGDAARPEPVES